MHRSTIFMTSVSIMALSALSGTAMAQYRDGPPRNSVLVAERSAQMKTSLAKAISLAEKHSKGVVIAIRLTTNESAFRADASGSRESGGTPRGERAPAYDRGDRDETDQTDANRQTNRPRRSEASQSEDTSSPMFAIVTCVIDRARVRDVVIDMSDGAVLGMQSVYASGADTWDESPGDMHGESRVTLVRATDLMNATARNAENERVGDIDELVLDPDSNRIIYGVLRRGGFLGFSEARYAVPATELTVPKDGRILLNLSNSDFEGHSGFGDDKWPTQADPEWSTTWDADAQKPLRATRILKATDLIGTNVQCSQGQKVGEITDLIVEPRSGRVVYAIVSSERGRIVVPMSVVQPMGEGRMMKMTQDEVLALPTLDAGTEPDWSDARWNRHIHERYNTKMNMTEARTESGQP